MSMNIASTDCLLGIIILPSHINARHVYFLKISRHFRTYNLRLMDSRAILSVCFASYSHCSIPNLQWFTTDRSDIICSVLCLWLDSR